MLTLSFLFLHSMFSITYPFSGQKYKCLAFQTLYVLICACPEIERTHYPVLKEYCILIAAFGMMALSTLHVLFLKWQFLAFSMYMLGNHSSINLESHSISGWNAFIFHFSFIFILPSIPDFAVNGSTELVHLVWRK